MTERNAEDWFKVVHGNSCRTINHFQEKNRDEIEEWIFNTGEYNDYEELPDGHILVWN